MAVDEEKAQEKQKEEIIDRTAPPGEVMIGGVTWSRSARMRNF
jgi:hypothetical protein